MPETILITGFEGYGGRADNPSAEVASALDGESFGQSTVVGRVLPVTNHNLRENIIGLIDVHRPEVVLCLGLAPGEKMIRLERLAANYSRFEIRDNSGDTYEGPVVKDGPAAFDSTLPLDGVLAAVLECGIPARLSNSAGTFLCNAIMYHTLEYCSGELPGTRCGFVHLPYMPSQVSHLISATETKRQLELEQRADLASMALETQINAVRAIAGKLAATNQSVQER